MKFIGVPTYIETYKNVLTHSECETIIKYFVSNNLLLKTKPSNEIIINEGKPYIVSPINYK